MIAGLKCAPEMWPIAETITPIASPLAIATPISVGSWIWLAATAAPAPMKISVNAPMNSATARRRASSDTMRNLRSRSDGLRLRTREPTAYTPGDAPQGHVLAQPDAVAVADVPLLLQVLRVRHAQGAPVRARGGDRDPRRRGAPAGQGAAGADRRAPRGQPRGARAAARVRARGLHRATSCGRASGRSSAACCRTRTSACSRARTSRGCAR